MKILTNTGLAALWNKIKTALAGKADKSHTHTKSQITDFVHTHDSSTSLISGYVATNASLSSYKAPLLTMDIPNDSNNMNYILVLMVEYTANSRNGYGFIALHIRKNDNNIIQYVRLFEISGNSWDMLSAYYNASTMKVELWGDLLQRWGCMRYTVLSWGANMYSKPEHLPSFITFSPSVFDTVQTPPSGFTEVACTRIGAAEIANKDILGNVINTTYLTTTGSNGTANGVSALINKLETGSATPTDNDYYVSQYVGGAQQTYHRRPMSALWSYIKGKANSVYALINHTHNALTIKNSAGSTLVNYTTAQPLTLQLSPSMVGARGVRDFIDTSGENIIDACAILGFGNDLYAFYDRGGTCTAYEYDTPYDPSNIPDFTALDLSAHKTSRVVAPFDAEVFNGGLQYVSNAPRSDTGNKYVIYDLDFTHFETPLNYSVKCFWSFGAYDVWGPYYMQILRKRDNESVFVRVYETTDMRAQLIPIGANGTNLGKLRIVMVPRTLGRLVQFGITYYEFEGPRSTLMSRCVDDYVFRNISPKSPNIHDLGEVYRYWRNVYASKFITKDGTASQLVTGTGELKTISDHTHTKAQITDFAHTHDTSDFTPALIAALKGSTGATGPQGPQGATGPAGPAGEAQQIVVGGNYTVQVVSAIPTTPAANVIYFISL